MNSRPRGPKYQLAELDAGRGLEQAAKDPKRSVSEEARMSDN